MEDGMTAVLITSLIVGFGLVLWLIIYRKRIFNRKKAPVVKRKPAFSLGGNFVEDLAVPIETKYEVTTNVLGSGSSAQVVIGENRRSKRKYAIKVIDLSRHEVAWRYEREKNFLRDIDHTNVVRLYEVYSAPTALYFVMELCTGGHLGQVLRASPEGRLDEDVAMEFIKQLTRAISHCHHHGICHRDVKLQNILLESSSKEAQIKLVDFGNGARFRNNLPLTKVVGTTYTAAPEVFKENYDERCDVWSMGVVTYILLSGRRPFEKMEVPINRTNGKQTVTKKEESVVASILLGKYHFNHEVWDEMSNDSINFIKHCFVMDYTRRNSAATMLEHPWLVDSTESMFERPNGIRKLSFNSSDTLRKTLGRELSSPFSGIRHISMLAVAFARPTDKVQLLRKVFQEVDYNGSGMIERDEFVTAMKLMNPDLSAAQTNSLFERIDQDENHCISFIEFLAATLDPKEVDLREMKQAFRLIDRENKGFISREDVWRILGTTNVEDFEQIQDNSKNNNPNNGMGSHGSTSAGQTSPALSQSSASQGPGHAALSAASHASHATSSSNNHAGNTNITAAHANLMSLSAAVGSAVGVSTRRRTLSVNGSGRTQPSGEDITDQRNRKLELRIDEIMEQADLNNDGVISYNEFLFAISGGDMSHTLMAGTGGGSTTSQLMLENLTNAPAILHLGQNEESFVSSLKKKLSEGNVLFSNNHEGRGKSFPVRSKPAPHALKPSWMSFYNPFDRNFLSRAAAGAGAFSHHVAVHPAGPSSSPYSAQYQPDQDSINSRSLSYNNNRSRLGIADVASSAGSVGGGANGSNLGQSPGLGNGLASSSGNMEHRGSGSVLGAVASGLKDISIVSHFLQPDAVANKDRDRESGSFTIPERERHTSLVDDIESQTTLKKFGSAPHLALSHSSKGPSWIEKPTPTSSFRVASSAAAGLISWNAKKPTRETDEVDIQAVIAKLEQSDRSRHSDLRMNYDDPGVLILAEKDKKDQRELKEQKEQKEPRKPSLSSHTPHGTLVALPSSVREMDSAEYSADYGNAIQMSDRALEDLEIGRDDSENNAYPYQ